MVNTIETQRKVGGNSLYDVIFGHLLGLTGLELLWQLKTSLSLRTLAECFPTGKKIIDDIGLCKTFDILLLMVTMQ